MTFSRGNPSGKAICFLVASLLLVSDFEASVTLPPVFSDHMVLQQGSTLPIWGRADPGEAVTVTIAGRSARTVAAANGSWRVLLRPIPATDTSLTLVVRGKNRIEISDVLLGDVWLCAGDGNMEFPLGEALGGKDVVGEGADNALRFFMPGNRLPSDSVRQGGGEWIVGTPLTVSRFSAVGYFFARDLRKSRHLPIGMIQCSESDAPVQSWISRRGLSEPPSFSKHRSEAARKVPSSLFNAMIAPLIPYAMTGVIWYQGECNEGSSALQYRRLFIRLIRDWRREWGEGPFPFLFVQPAGFGNEEGLAVEPYAGENHHPGRALPWLREGVASALSLSCTGMAVATDLGLPDERFSPYKLDVGRRLALLARNRVYGEEIVAEGPSYHSLQVEGGKARVTFSHVGDGLTLGLPPIQQEDAGQPVKTSLTGFALCGADKKWFPATGEIQKESVLLSSPGVSRPVAVRYNWKGFPSGNLYNKEGLPVPPFRSDDFQPEF